MKNQKGITLIELLISLVIASVILAGVYRVFISEAQVYSTQDALAEAQNAARIGMEILVADLRMAGFDRQNSAGGSTVTPNPVVGSSHNVRVEWEENNTTLKAVQYYLQDGKLVRDVFLNGVKNGDTEEVLDNVEDLSLTYIMSGPKYVRANVSLTLAATAGGNVLNRTLASSVIFRNVR